MSAHDSSITPVNGNGKGFSTQVDMGLEVPEAFDAVDLFPEDRLLRLHPNWFVLETTREQERFSAAIKDYATEKEFTLSGIMDCRRNNDELLAIRLDNGFDTTITFFRNGTTLAVRVTTPEEPDADDPLLLWIRAIREYLRIYLTTTVMTLFWRMWMNRVLLTMNPSQRKICLMIFRFTLLEVLVIILIVTGYALFVR